MKANYSLDESLTHEKVLAMCKQLFPERSVSTRTIITGKMVQINLDLINCAFVKVSHKKDGMTMTLNVQQGLTIFGSIFFGGLISYFMSKASYKEVERIVKEYMDRNFVSKP